MLKCLVVTVAIIYGAVASDFDLVNACNSKGSFKTLTGVTVKCEVVQ